MTGEPKPAQDVDAEISAANRRIVVDTLDHLVYVIECLACNIAGEAKTELSRLIDTLEKSKFCASEQILAELRESQRLLHASQHRAAVSPLSRVRAALWKELKTYVVPSA